ncbi:hypothetical protein EVAR_94386_1 [Eumeta japonica]|uniref:Uncharacterized protein n=1 Tax=Eumeta variegata TaxID=151549 RepID=A0A4C1TQ14_EUMVA|nr:hypothetical protein EVAR_94386_1 [Eumeta japonica]
MKSRAGQRLDPTMEPEFVPRIRPSSLSKRTAESVDIEDECRLGAGGGGVCPDALFLENSVWEKYSVIIDIDYTKYRLHTFHMQARRVRCTLARLTRFLATRSSAAPAPRRLQLHSEMWILYRYDGIDAPLLVLALYLCARILLECI